MIQTDILLSVTDSSGKIKYTNNGFDNFYKFSKKDILGKTHNVLKSGQHSTVFYEKLWNSVLKGKQWTGVIKNKAKDGNETWIHTTLIPLRKDNKIQEIVCIGNPLHDTTSSSHTNLQNLKHALDQTSIVAITDKNGIITHVNKKFCKISKYSEHELIGKAHSILKSNYHPLTFFEDMWNSILEGKIWHGDIKNKAKDGTYYWIKTTIVPILSEDEEITQFISIGTNITDEKQLMEHEKTREKFETIGKLSSRIAHDIRNPLSVIRACVENLKLSYELDETKNKNMDKIDRAIDRIVHQIDDVLDFVKHDTLNFSPCSLLEVLQESLDNINIPNNVTIEIPKNDMIMLCDKVRISVVFINLIRNAIQAIDGNGTISITFEKHDSDVKINVKDSGPGIDKHLINKLFEPLFTTKQQGTGLGLSSVKSIIEAHNGTITVQSPPTIFSIILPSIIS